MDRMYSFNQFRAPVDAPKGRLKQCACAGGATPASSRARRVRSCLGRAWGAAVVLFLLAPIEVAQAAKNEHPLPVVQQPELPRVSMDTTFPSTAGYSTIEVREDGNLKDAIEKASCNPNGTVLRLAAGATFTGTFTLPAKNCAPGQWIIIRTDTADSNLPPPESRITPSFAPTLAKIISPNVAPAVKTASGAEHYWFMGVEIGVANDTRMSYAVIEIGDKESALADLPHHIVFDRCYVHGNEAGNIRRGLAANGASIAVINSYFENFHVAGEDTQAIASWNGSGPFKIVNNFLEASGENVMFGGAMPFVPGVIPSDIEIRRNHFFKPLSWKPSDPSLKGSTWTVKNLLEFKNAQRVLVEGNVLENNWAQAQSGFAVLFTPRGQRGRCPWCTVADVTFRYNILLHSGGGFNIAGQDDSGPSQPSQRIWIHDNLILDIDGTKWGGQGRLYQVLNGGQARMLAPPHDITISHNTAFENGSVMTCAGNRDNPIPHFLFVNNLQPHGVWGITGSGTRPGVETVLSYFTDSAFTHNVIFDLPFKISPPDYPPGNFFPSDLNAVQFVDSKSGDFHLKPTSRYHDAGTDGKDIGADIDALLAATAGVAH